MLIGKMLATFILGLVVAVLVNLGTLFYNKRRALDLIPWLAMYVVAHGMIVLVSLDRIKESVVPLARQYPLARSYAFVMIVFAVVGAVAWAFVLAGTDKLSRMDEKPEAPVSQRERPLTQETTPQSTAAPSTEQPTEPLRSQVMVNSPGGQQAGRDIVNNPAVGFIEPDALIMDALEKGIIAIVATRAKIHIAVEVESGSSSRSKVAETIGAVLQRNNIGGFASGNVFVGRFPEAPISLFYSDADRNVAASLIQALSSYISVDGVQLRSWRNVGEMRLYLNGQTTFKPNGYVVIE